MKNQFILLLLALLGFSACEPGEQPCEYGVPTAQFTIKGRVTDAAGVPVRGIRVNPHEAWFYDPEKPDEGFDRKESFWKDGSALTDEQGQFTISNSCFNYTDYRVSLQIDDVDGAANGGAFESQEVVVSIGPEECTGRQSWVSEYLKQADDVVLTKSKE